MTTVFIIWLVEMTKLSLNGTLTEINGKEPVKRSSPRRLVRQKVTHFNGVDPIAQSEG